MNIYWIVVIGLIVLKLTGILGGLSWIVVLLPLWLPVALIIAAFVLWLGYSIISK